MKNECAEWKDQLLEAALVGRAEGALAEHVKQCAECAKELSALRGRRECLDDLLPLVAQGAELSTEFGARVLAAAEAARQEKQLGSRRIWGLAAAMAGTAAAVIGLTMYWKAQRNLGTSELAEAQKLAEWQAPSDALLETPGRAILRTTPKVGESYLPVAEKTPAKAKKEE